MRTSMSVELRWKFTQAEFPNFGHILLGLQY